MKLKFNINDAKKLEKVHFHEVIELLHSEMSKFKPSKKNYPEIFESFSNQKNVIGLVILYKSEVIAYGSIIFEIKIRGSVIGHIEDIVTSSKYRNFGAASAILQKLKYEAEKKKCYKITLGSYPDSVNFYKKNGFKVIRSKAMEIRL